MEKNKKAQALFILAPMTEKYEDVIWGGLKKLDACNVVQTTERMGTIYSGKPEDVIDAVFACFGFAYQDDLHMTMSLTLKSDGGEAELYKQAANYAEMQKLAFNVDARFDVYPQADFAKEKANEMGIFKREFGGQTVLSADINKIVEFFAWLAAEISSESTVEATFSVNSPTVE